jgi:hypothetical protein
LSDSTPGAVITGVTPVISYGLTWGHFFVNRHFSSLN